MLINCNFRSPAPYTSAHTLRTLALTQNDHVYGDSRCGVATSPASGQHIGTTEEKRCEQQYRLVVCVCVRVSVRV